jgi:tight adherence protein C
MVLLLVIAALCFAAALVLLAETAMPEARRRHDAVESVRRFSGLASFGRTRGRRAPAVAGAERIGSRFASTKFRDRLPQRLASAGLAGKVTVEAFIAFRAGVAAVGVVGGLCLGALIGASGGAMLFLAAFIGGVAFLATGYSLEHRAKKRRRAIHAALPDALDLLAVTVEAGLGLYGAIQHLVEMTEGPLADELALVLTEVRVGDSSERALKRMAARLQSKEIESLVRSLIQGEQLGLSLARTLRNLAEDTREKRRATAEELASKAPIKMLFPTAFFIFPAMFVAILGPAFLNITTYLHFK